MKNIQSSSVSVVDFEHVNVGRDQTTTWKNNILVSAWFLIEIHICHHGKNTLSHILKSYLYFLMNVSPTRTEHLKPFIVR